MPEVQAIAPYAEGVVMLQHANRQVFDGARPRGGRISDSAAQLYCRRFG